MRFLVLAALLTALPLYASAQEAPRLAPLTAQLGVGADALVVGFGADVLFGRRTTLRLQHATGLNSTGATLLLTRHAGAGRSRLEYGGGALLADGSDFASEAVAVAYAGYRRHPGPGGLLLRAGVAAYFDGETIFPFPGVAVGVGLGKPRR